MGAIFSTRLKKPTMKPKDVINMFPYGYVRLRNHNGSVALTLDTPNTEAFVFMKRILRNHKMPEIDQRQIDMLQIDFGKDKPIIDWFDNTDCRYFITMSLDKNPVEYKLVLNVSFGIDTFEAIGFFAEKKDGTSRKKIFNERYLKDISSDTLTTQTDFAEERYDIIFPDDPMSHCRRLADIMAMKAFPPADLTTHKLENYDNSNNEPLENDNEDNVK